MMYHELYEHRGITHRESFHISQCTMFSNGFGTELQILNRINWHQLSENMHYKRWIEWEIIDHHKLHKLEMKKIHSEEIATNKNNSLIPYLEGKRENSKKTRFLFCHLVFWFFQMHIHIYINFNYLIRRK